MAKVKYRGYYDQVTVIAVDLDIDVPKYQGGSYKGSRITYRDSKGVVEDQAVGQGHLDNSWQKELKEAFGKAKAGDEITFYKERLVDEKDINMTAEEAKEKYKFVSLISIHEGHIIPPEMQAGGNTAPITQAAAPAQAAPKDHAGMLTGHALTCAAHLLSPAKAKDKKVLESAAFAIAELTGKLVQAQSGDKYLAGLRVGNAVTCACITVGQFADVESQALLVLGVSTNVKERIVAMQEVDKTNEEAEKEAAKQKLEAEKKAEEAKAAQEKADAEKVEFDDDTIPF